MFYYSDSVFIAFALLLLLMLTVGRAELEVPVERSVGVKYPDIDECMSVMGAPEVLCLNV